MKTLALLILFAVTGFAGKPEKGVYSPTVSTDFTRRDGELYPSALGLRPWKPADPAQFSGEFTDIADAGSSILLRVGKRKSTDGTEWQTDGEWKLNGDAKPARTVVWSRACVELDSKHSYTYGARGCFFCFFVLYRDPDHPDQEPRAALLIGDRLFARK